MQQTMKVSYNNTEFTFRAEPNFRDEQTIKQKMIELIGGYEVLAELETSISEVYQKHLAFLKKQLGEDVFETKHKKYLELLNTEIESTELDSLRVELNSDIFYKRYINLVTQKTLVYNYAFMEVMCITPENYNFYEQKEEDLIILWGLIEKERSFFRKKDPETKKIDKS